MPTSSSGACRWGLGPPPPQQHFERCTVLLLFCAAYCLFRGSMCASMAVRLPSCNHKCKQALCVTGVVAKLCPAGERQLASAPRAPAGNAHVCFGLVLLVLFYDVVPAGERGLAPALGAAAGGASVVHGRPLCAADHLPGHRVPQRAGGGVLPDQRRRAVSSRVQCYR